MVIFWFYWICSVEQEDFYDAYVSCINSEDCNGKIQTNSCSKRRTPSFRHFTIPGHTDRRQEKRLSGHGGVAEWIEQDELSNKSKQDRPIPKVSRVD